MIAYILRRTGQALISMFAVTIFVFAIVRLTGDPLQVLLPTEASQEQYDDMRAYLHLDDPLPTQYVAWISGIVTGNLGESTHLRVPVTRLIEQRLPATLQLAAAAFPIALFFGVVIGVFSAAHRGSALDGIGRIFAVIGQATPAFVIGIVLIMVFGVMLRVLPAGGYGDAKSLVLPAIALGWYPMAGIMRLTRSSMIDVLGSEYIKLARVKGVSEMGVLWKHAFKNAALPVLTYASLVFIFMIRGAVVVETVFAWPGLGRLVYDAIINRDFPIVQGVVLLFSSWVIFGNLIVDVAYAYLNPRIRY